MRQIEKIFKDKEARRKEFIEQYGHIGVPQMVQLNGSTFTAVGGSIYKQTHPGEYTFLHAIHDHALHFFGENYLKAQESLPMESRHPALQWMHAYVESTQNSKQRQIGAGAAWLRFAYDLYTISDNANLEARMKERLLKYRYFQGARHELWTAALFITAGFEINFEDESDATKKHPEFIALDKESGIRIGVEAKSRQRRGVLGFSEGSDIPPGEEVGIKKLIGKAYKKESGVPLFVVIDTNLPPQSERWSLDYWLSQIQKAMEDLANEGRDDPCPANLILFYNDPSHHMISEEIGNQSDSLWISDYMPACTINYCEKTFAFRARLLKAQKQRSRPPVIIPDM